MKISSYKELEAYKKSYSNVKKIYGMTQKFPKHELYGMASQLRRASVSIPLNIAEGYMRGSKEYVQFLKTALGSAAEVETLISLSRDLDYCSEEDFHAMYNLNLESTKLLRTYIRRLTGK